MFKFLAVILLASYGQGFRVPPPLSRSGHRVIIDHHPPAEYARPRVSSVLLDEGDHGYLKHEISDPDVGPDGITAVKDKTLGACFLYKYMKNLVIPTVQRHFYARIKTATVVVTPKDDRKFKMSVGDGVYHLCHESKSFWLDDNMLFMYMTNRLHPKGAPPPPPVGEDEEELSVPMLFPTPPPLNKPIDLRVPQSPPKHADLTADLGETDMRAPPALPVHRMKTPPPL